MNRPRNFKKYISHKYALLKKNKHIDKHIDVTKTIFVTSVVIGLIAGSCFKDLKIFSLIIGAFRGD